MKKRYYKPEDVCFYVDGRKIHGVLENPDYVVENYTEVSEGEGVAITDWHGVRMYLVQTEGEDNGR